MWEIFKDHWRLYLIEAWALGMFMVSAIFFTILLEHPAWHVRGMVESGLSRRAIIGLAMGVTAVLLIYSPWGKKSGAHMNPAVTIAFLMLKRICFHDAVYYIFAQFVGGLTGVLLMQVLFSDFIADVTVNFAITVPGTGGLFLAFVYEFFMSLILFGTILIVGNSAMKAFTGYFAGFLLLIFISVEAPYSGMSINPARTVASALPANIFTDIWIYFAAPVLGMVLAGVLYRGYIVSKTGNCKAMQLHLNGQCEDSESYTPEI